MFAFDENFAVRYGVDCAVMLQNFIFWTRKNRANGEGFHDGYWWIYNSYNAFTEIFPFWTPKQIRRILSTLVEKNALVKGNFNKNQFDRTLWYALSEEIMKKVFPEDCSVTEQDDAAAQTGNSQLPKRAILNCPNGQLNIGTDTNQIQTRYKGEGAPAPEPAPENKISEVGDGTLFDTEKQASVGDGAPQSQEKKKGKKSCAAPFVPPTLAEVKDYIENARRSPIDPVAFFAHYENNDWRLSSGRRMKDWRLAVVTWERRDRNGWGR